MSTYKNIDDEIDFTEDPGMMWDRDDQPEVGEQISDESDDDSKANEIDSASYMDEIHEQFGKLLHTISDLNVFTSNPSTQDIRNSFGISNGGLEVLIAHPELIRYAVREPDITDMSQAKFTLSNTDERGRRLAHPIVRYNARVSANMQNNVTDTTGETVASLLSDAMSPYMNDLGTNTYKKLTADEFDSMPELSDEEKAGKTEKQINAIRTRKAKHDELDKFHDSAALIRANKFATMVDRLRAGIILSAMNEGKTLPGEAPENSGKSVSDFNVKMDAITDYIKANYSDSAQKIASLTHIDERIVNDILEHAGTAFGIPAPTEESSEADREAYEYAKDLIPWLYYLVSEYKGNTEADADTAGKLSTHTGNLISRQGITGAGATGAKLYNFGAAADMLQKLGNDQNVHEFISGLKEVLANRFPGAIKATDDGLMVTGPDTTNKKGVVIHGRPMPVSDGELVSLAFTTSDSSVMSGEIMASMTALHPDKEAVYKDAHELLNNTRLSIKKAIGKGGPTNSMIDDTKKVLGEVNKQIKNFGFANRPGDVAALIKCTSDLAESRGVSGYKNLVGLLGFNATSNQVKSSSNYSFLGKVISDPTIANAMRDISTVEKSSAETDADGNPEAAGAEKSAIGYRETFVDPATTAATYVKNSAPLHMSDINSDEENAKQGKAFMEIPLSNRGSLMGSLVAPEQMVPMYTDRLQLLSAGSENETKLYGEIIPRLVHYILHKNHGSIDLGHDEIYGAEGEFSYESVTAATAIELTHDINSFFAELSKDADESISCRNSWVKLIYTFEPDHTFISKLISAHISRIYGEHSDEASDVRFIEHAYNNLIGHVCSNVFYINQKSHDISLNGDSDITVLSANSWNGVNRSATGRILRKTGTGEGGITRDALYMNMSSGANVSDETGEFFEVSFKHDPSVKFASAEDANGYVKPTLETLNVGSGSFYSLWIGIVAFSDYSSGTAENTHATDERVKAYHQRKLDEYLAHRGSQATEESKRADEAYSAEVAKFASHNGIDAQTADNFISAMSKAAGSNSEHIRKLSLYVVNAIEKMMKAADKTGNTQIRATIEPQFTLKKFLDGSLIQSVSAYASADPMAKNAVKYYDQLNTFSSMEILRGVVSNESIGNIADGIKGAEIPAVFDLTYIHSVKSSYGSSAGIKNLISGDPSLYERPAKYSDSIIERSRVDEDNNQDIADARNGIREGFEIGGDLTTYAEEHGVDSVSESDSDYSEVFAEKYPVLGMVKTGKGMASHSSLRSGDALCSTGLNAYDMDVLLKGLDSSHAEVFDLQRRYENGNHGEEMTMVHTKNIISYLENEFYDLFTASGRGSMRSKDPYLAYTDLLEQCVTRFKTVAKDSQNPTLSDKIMDCVRAIDEIMSVESGDLAGKITGIANVIIYLEAYNPENTVQSERNGSMDLADETAKVPEEADKYAKLAASAFKDSGTKDSVIERLRDDIRSGNVKMFGENTKFGQTVAQLYYGLDRGKTEGFNNQLDPFDYMIEKMRVKAVDKSVNIHGHMANTDLMSEFASAIIDDEREADGAHRYPRVAALIKKLSNGESVDSWYLLTSDPHSVSGSDASVDGSSTVKVSYGKDGVANKKVGENGNVPAGAAFSTEGDLAKAITGMSGNAYLAKVKVKNPNESLVGEDGNVSDEVIDDIVRGVRIAITENLISDEKTNNTVNPRIENLFYNGAMSIKNGSDKFVSLSLIIMLLYSRSIDKAKYSVNSAAAERMSDRMRRGQAKQIGSDVDELLAKNGALRIGTDSDDSDEPAIRTDSSASEAANQSDNVDAMRNLSKKLAGYRQKLGLHVEAIPTGKETNAEKESAKNEIVDMMSSKSVADMVINGYLRITKDETNPTKLLNTAYKYVGQLVATDPMMRDALLKGSQTGSDREDFVAMQGTTPMDDMVSSRVMSRHANGVQAILSKPAAERSREDKKRLIDLGVTESGLNMFDSVVSDIERYMESFADSAKQYHKYLPIASNANATGRRVENAKNIVRANNPENGTTVLATQHKLADLIDSVFDPENDTRYSGITKSSDLYTDCKDAISTASSWIAGHASDEDELKTVKADRVAKISSLLAKVYAFGGKIYRNHLNNVIGVMNHDPMLSDSRLNNDDCEKLFAAMAKVNRNLSIGASVPGSSETMVKICGELRNENELAAIVNSSVNKVLDTDDEYAWLLDDIDSLLINPTNEGEDFLEKIAEVIVANAKTGVEGAGTAKSFMAQFIADGIKASSTVVNGNGLFRDGDEYVIRLKDMYGVSYKCIIPLRIIHDAVNDEIRSRGLDGMKTTDPAIWELSIMNKISRQCRGLIDIYGSPEFDSRCKSTGITVTKEAIGIEHQDD